MARRNPTSVAMEQKEMKQEKTEVASCNVVNNDEEPGAASQNFETTHEEMTLDDIPNGNEETERTSENAAIKQEPTSATPDEISEEKSATVMVTEDASIERKQATKPNASVEQEWAEVTIKDLLMILDEIRCTNELKMKIIESTGPHDGHIQGEFLINTNAALHALNEQLLAKIEKLSGPAGLGEIDANERDELLDILADIKLTVQA
ncbi:hypothetical protein KEM56_001743 [Ascosphaera pollenicola]|nr:hypothetical protein KEM56_001743 [Ascosphaera pollenicola]